MVTTFIVEQLEHYYTILTSSRYFDPGPKERKRKRTEKGKAPELFEPQLESRELWSEHALSDKGMTDQVSSARKPCVTWVRG